MDKKYLIGPKKILKAVVYASMAYVFMTLFWKFMGSFIDMQSSYLAWSWNLVRKLTTLGSTIIAFFGGLE